MRVHLHDCNTAGYFSHQLLQLPNIQDQFKNPEWLCERAILAPKNSSVNSINSQIQNFLPGISKTYKSIDTVTDPDQAVYYPTEFLNSLEPPGMPSHNLELKIGAAIILLRNLDPLNYAMEHD